jgi:hypothetical protein
VRCNKYMGSMPEAAKTVQEIFGPAKPLAALRKEREGPVVREPQAHGLDPWGWEGEMAAPQTGTSAPSRYLSPGRGERKSPSDRV